MHGIACCAASAMIWARWLMKNGPGATFAAPTLCRTIATKAASISVGLVAFKTMIVSPSAQRTSDLSESLEQQTATSEVLGVISSSPGELEPVFAAMLRNAVQLCDAKFGNIYRWDGEALRLVAGHNTPTALAEARRHTPLRPAIDSLIGQMIATKTAIHVDAATHQGYVDRSDPGAITAVELGGVRTVLAVPMLKEDELVGSFTVYRQESRPFTEKQIALVTNFAAQAVIAIENTRLLNELRQSLERQTATSDVLRVISSSPGHLEPVFQAILENATRICGAKFGGLWMVENDGVRLSALYGASPGFADFMWRTPFIKPGPLSAVGRSLRTKQSAQIDDLAAARGYVEGDHLITATVDIGGGRTLVAVPMLKDEEVVGAITIYRQEVQPFTPKQIELVENFAAQAVIAIENTRLLNELRQSLERQTATSEVLSVISSSPGELEPIFQAILLNATRICEAKFAELDLFDGKAFRWTAHVGTPPQLSEFQRARGLFQPLPGGQMDRVMRTKQVIHTADNTADAVPMPAAELGGARSIVSVPMLKEQTLIGIIHIFRQEVRPFTDKQIELVQNFAAQAVIAIENTRLLNELREVDWSNRLRHQRY